MLLAIVNDDIVTNIVTILDESFYSQHAQSAQAAVDITNLTPQPQVGWAFNGSILTPPANYTSPIKTITKLAFRQRFTFTELMAIETASQTSVALRVLKDNLNVATFIDLSRTDTIQAIGMLTAAGLITSDRANIILTTPPSNSELYTGR
jgi:hypothetical protein